MLGLNFSSFSFVLLGAFVGALYCFRGKPGTAIGAGMALALLSATWIAPSVGGILVDCRVVLAAVLLVAFCFHPLGRFRFCWHWLDVTVVLLMLFGCISDLRFSGSAVAVPIRLYGELLLPYFAGRFMSMRGNSIPNVSLWFCSAGLVVSAGTIIESVYGYNIWEWLFMPTDDLVIRNRSPRYDVLYRAAGPTRHPIFLGVIFTLILPWAFPFIFRQGRYKTTFFGVVVFMFLFIGIVFTVSRGPLFGLIIAVVSSICIRWPRCIKYIALVGVFAAGNIVLYWPQFIELIESTESTSQRSSVITLGEDNITYSGTRNRILVWDIYLPLVGKGGAIGFGTEAVSTFPPNIPGLPASAKARDILGIVDNSYLLTGLRFGWIGLSLFLLLIFGSIVTAIRLRRSAGMILYPDGPAFLTALASCLIGVSFVMLTVFSSFDFMFWVYFHCGVVAGLASLRDSMLKADTYVAS